MRTPMKETPSGRSQGAKKWEQAQITNGGNFRSITEDPVEEYEQKNLAQLADGRKPSMTSERTVQRTSRTNS